VQGDAAGFGVGLVALSDVAVAAPDAYFSFPGGGRGLRPGARARVAREACELGLLTDVVAIPPTCPAAVSSVVGLLQSKPPHVHAQIKELMRLYATLPEDRRTAIASDRLAVGVQLQTLAEQR